MRVLLRLGRGSMAHFELAPGRVSRAVAHRAVEELWPWPGDDEAYEVPGEWPADARP